MKTKRRVNVEGKSAQGPTLTQKPQATGLRRWHIRLPGMKSLIGIQHKMPSQQIMCPQATLSDLSMWYLYI